MMVLGLPGGPPADQPDETPDLLSERIDTLGRALAAFQPKEFKKGDLVQQPKELVRWNVKWPAIVVEKLAAPIVARNDPRTPFSTDVFDYIVGAIAHDGTFVAAFADSRCFELFTMPKGVAQS